MIEGITVIGDYRPIKVMYNGKQISGAVDTTVTGKDIAVNGTYNDCVDTAMIQGYTALYRNKFIVTTNDQTPDNPVFIVGSYGNLISAGSVDDTFYTILPLYAIKIPQATYDAQKVIDKNSVYIRDDEYYVCDYEVINRQAKTRTKYEYTAELILNGSISENWVLTGSVSENYQGFALKSSDLSAANMRSEMLCDKFKYSAIETISNTCSQTNSVYGIRFVVSRQLQHVAEGTVPEWKLYLATNPVTIRYIRAIPQITSLEYKDIATYPQYTRIYSDCVVQPLIQAKMKIMEK